VAAPFAELMAYRFALVPTAKIPPVVEPKSS
jgi:hypothetical protein